MRLRLLLPIERIHVSLSTPHVFIYLSVDSFQFGQPIANASTKCKTAVSSLIGWLVDNHIQRSLQKRPYPNPPPARVGLSHMKRLIAQS